MTSQAASLKTKTIEACLPIPSPVNVDDNLKKKKQQQQQQQ